MNSVDLLKAVYYNYLKPTPNKLSENLGSCLRLVRENNLIPQVLKLCDLSSSATQKDAQSRIRKWVERILELINVPTGTGEDRNRAAAIALLIETISNASYELVHTYREQWMSTLTLILNRKNENAMVLGVAAFAVSELILKCCNWDQTRREVLKESVFGSFLQQLLKHLEESPIESCAELLKALLNMLSGAQRNKLKIPVERTFRLLLRILVESFKLNGLLRSHVYRDAMSCIPLVVDSSATWLALLEQFILAIGLQLDDLYLGFESEKSSIKSFLPKSKPFDESELPAIVEIWRLNWKGPNINSPKIDLPFDLHRLFTAVKSIQLLLTSRLNYVVDIPLVHLLAVVRNLTLLDGTSKSNSSVYGMSVGHLIEAIPQLHIMGYNLLETIVSQLKTILYPHVRPFLSLLLHAINTSRDSKAFALGTASVKSALYQLTQAYFEVFKSSSSHIAHQIIEHALVDIQLEVSSGSSLLSAPQSELLSKLNESSQNNQKVNPNKKKAAQKALSDPRAHVNAETLNAMKVGENSLSQASIAKTPDIVRISALRTICSALKHMGSSLKDEIRARIDKSALGLLIAMQRNRNNPMWAKTNFSPAFANPNFRIALYSVLLSSAMVPSRIQTPVLPYAIQYLDHGMTDPNIQVAAFCSFATQVCLTLIHPRIPLISPNVSKEQRTSKLSFDSLLESQNEQLLLQQQEERTLVQLQRAQGRRPRDFDDDMDDRPAKKTKTASVESNEPVHSFLGNLSSASMMEQTIEASTSKHTILFDSSSGPSEMKAVAPIAMETTDTDIVDDGPDSEDEN